MGLADLLGGAEPFVRVRGRHADVDDRDVGLVAPDLEQEVVGGARLARDLEPGLLEELHDPLPQEHGVVGDHNAHQVSFRGTVCLGRHELARKILVEHLEDPLAVWKAGQPMLAEVGEVCGPRRHPRACGGRDEDLPAHGGGTHPGGAVDVEPDVPVLGRCRLARVDAHPHPRRPALRPVVPDERELRGDGRSDRGVRLGEGREELVRPGVDLVAALLLDCGPDQPAMGLEHVRKLHAEGAGEGGRALDVGEEKGDVAARQGHDCESRRV